MYIDKYWGNFIGGSDDSLNLVAFLEDQKKEEIPCLLYTSRWRDCRETAAVIDPHYGTEKVFHVYEVEINGQIHRFAAGEFSNCVWGFYLEKNG